MKINSLFLTTFLFLILISISSAASPEYKTKTLNEEFTFCQTCSDATYITLSSIDKPSGVEFINTNMTSMGSGDFCYNYTPTEIGTLQFRGISDGCIKTWIVDIPINEGGDSFSIEQSIILISNGIIVLLLMAMGFSFSKEKWKIRSFFFAFAFAFALVLLNSARIIVGSSQSLAKMGDLGLILGIVTFSFIILYLLIHYTVEVIKYFQKKSLTKWGVSNEPY